MIVASLANCFGSSDAHLNQARDFIDAYFVLSNQDQALNLTMGPAEEKLKKEIELLKDMPGRTESHRSRDIVFELKKTMQADQQVSYLFELTIIIPDFEDQKKQVVVTIDKETGKVVTFSVM